MHQPFMDFQRAHVALVEHRIGADLNVIRAGRRVRDNAIGLEHPDGFLGLAEHFAQAGLQQVHSVLGG